ncbi:MAG TPA: ATP-binding protein [Anaerolineales bacterium]
MLKEKQQLAPEMLVPMLGEALVSAGRISAEGLEKALNYQNERGAAGQSVLLGQALLDLQLIDRASLDEAVTEQIIQLRAALQTANRTLDRRIRERTEELQRALERLSEMEEMKANFVANISHELRTPLTHIKGYLELMSTDSLGKLTDEQRHAVQVSQKATKRLEKLIEDLLTFSRASHGEVSFRQEALDLQTLVNRAIRDAAAKAEAGGVSVRLLAPEALPQVQGDREKLLWAIAHLLDNAIKFTPSGGRVVLSLKPESTNLVMIAVSDTGVGIPAEGLQRIFEPFQQLDGSATRRAGGTGLGLTLVRQIVEAHGSVLEVTSTEGKGTTFKFPLLVATEASHPRSRKV